SHKQRGCRILGTFSPRFARTAFFRRNSSSLSSMPIFWSWVSNRFLDHWIKLADRGIIGLGDCPAVKANTIKGAFSVMAFSISFCLMILMQTLQISLARYLANLGKAS